MQDNRVSIKIDPADHQKVLEAVKTITDTIKPYVIALTPAERRTLPKMGDGTLPFVIKALDYAISNPGFVPAYIDVGELKVDVDAIEALLQIVRPLEQASQNLNDTILLSGSEAYVAALAFYNSVKQAAKLSVPGAKPIAEDLSARFDKSGTKKLEKVKAEPS